MGWVPGTDSGDPESLSPDIHAGPQEVLHQISMCVMFYAGDMLKPIPTDFGQEAGYTLDWSPANHRHICKSESEEETTLTPDYDYTATFDYDYESPSPVPHCQSEPKNKASVIGPPCHMLLLGLLVCQMKG
ncbi:uncharacterized protein LOC129185735 isoform X2 [Dunckerocampus dactyliophorus]|uniref:uncharacterized protein LOC129185735 isoform X2 n=1 Tax=Dunckerocampus dactyliophorus TaxID=161453 RepID=UPI002405E450|nr:uncharacterized protein LOC129185735 isoform X2 [Dunckerocampus dactyliophorus]